MDALDTHRNYNHRPDLYLGLHRIGPVFGLGWLMNVPREWTEMVKPMVARCELAAKLGMHATWNADDAAALGELLQIMATKLDDEIERRATTRASRWKAFFDSDKRGD